MSSPVTASGLALENRSPFLNLLFILARPPLTSRIWFIWPRCQTPTYRLRASTSAPGGIHHNPFLRTYGRLRPKTRIHFQIKLRILIRILTRRQPLINAVRLTLVTPEPDQTELGLDHAGLNLAHSDIGIDEFAQEGAVEGRDGGFGGAIDAAPGVGLAPGDGAEVDDCLGGVSD